MALASLRRLRDPSRPAARPRPTFRPRVEWLEDRLTPSGGLLDPTFGSGGIVNLPNTTDVSARAVVVQPDGKVVIAGYINQSNGYTWASVQRLNRDGSLDTTFNQTGSLTLKTGRYGSANAVALQPDGKILVGGGYSGGSLVARLNANGTLDTTFGSKGLWESSTAAAPNNLAVLTNATHTTVTGIVAAATGGANGVPCFEAFKLTPAGAADKTFGSGGVVVFSGLSGNIHSMAMAPSGEIYLAGSVQFGGMTYQDGCIAAVTPAGALDTSFGGGSGYVLADPTGTQYSEFFDVAVQTLTVNGQAASRLIASGHKSTSPGSATGYEEYVVAYTVGGALDTSFGSGGWFIDSNPNIAGDRAKLALEADGSIVVGWEQATDTGGEMLIGHLTANGTADTSFGSDGTGFVAISDGDSCVLQGVAIDPTDGGIVACGRVRVTNNNSIQQAVVVRLTAP